MISQKKSIILGFFFWISPNNDNMKAVNHKVGGSSPPSSEEVSFRNLRSIFFFQIRMEWNNYDLSKKKV